MLLATDLGRLLPGTHLPRRLRGPQVEETRMVSVFSFSFSLPFSLSLSFFLFRSSFRSSFFSLSFSLFRSSFCSSFRSSFFSFSSPNRVESSRIESNRIARRSYTRCRRWRDASLDGKVKRAREREIESGHDVHLVEYEQHWRACTAIGWKISSWPIIIPIRSELTRRGRIYAGRHGNFTWSSGLSWPMSVPQLPVLYESNAHTHTHTVEHTITRNWANSYGGGCICGQWYLHSRFVPGASTFLFFSFFFLIIFFQSNASVFREKKGKNERRGRYTCENSRNDRKY